MVEVRQGLSGAERVMKFKLRDDNSATQNGEEDIVGHSTLPTTILDSLQLPKALLFCTIEGEGII